MCKSIDGVKQEYSSYREDKGEGKRRSRVRCHSFSTNPKLSEKLIFLTPIRTRACAYKGVRNVRVRIEMLEIIDFWEILPTY